MLQDENRITVCRLRGGGKKKASGDRFGIGGRERTAISPRAVPDLSFY